MILDKECQTMPIFEMLSISELQEYYYFFMNLMFDVGLSMQKKGWIIFNDSGISELFFP